MSYEKRILAEKIRRVAHHQPATLNHTATVRNAIETLQKSPMGCAAVMQNQQLAGIVTERDLLRKVLTGKIKDDSSVAELMTQNPATLKDSDTVEDAIRLMNEHNFRHIPIVDDTGKLAAMVAMEDVVEYIVSYFANTVLNLPPHLHQFQDRPEGG